MAPENHNGEQESVITTSQNLHVAEGQNAHARYWVWFALLVVILFTGAIRVRLLAVPLERDEGEYAYAAQLILQGVPPYAQVYNMKMPGVYAAYALILALFGQTHIGIHFGLLVINAGTILLMYFLGKRLFNPFIGLGAAAAFAVLSLGHPVMGFTANAEHFVILFALAGILLLLHALEHEWLLSLLASAILLGLAFLMKQHGAAFVAFAGLYLLLHELRRRQLKWNSLLARILLFSFGLSLPFLLTCLLLWWAAVFDKFWFWTFDYAREYVSILSPRQGLSLLKIQIPKIVRSTLWIWVLAGCGLTGLLWDERARQRGLFVAGFVLFSFLAVCPGFYFREHYFILLLPAVALLTGLGAHSFHSLFARCLTPARAKAALVVSLLVVLYHALYQQRIYFFVMSPTMIARTTYTGNPFSESLEIARFIKENSATDDCIAVLGSEPQIYFYSNRRSATGYVYMYPLMEKHSYALKMQEELVSEIESARPKFLVFVSVRASWMARSDSEQLIFEWLQRFQGQYYRPVGVIDILRDGTVYRWRDQAVGYKPLSSCWLAVLQRKDYDLHNSILHLSSDSPDARLNR